MISNNTIQILKKSIADTRRRVLSPIHKLGDKLNTSDDPKYLQGEKKKSEANDGAKNE